MSRDLIKRTEFSELYSRGEEGVGAPLRYTSARVRFRELLDRITEAEARERRNVEKAVMETRAQVEEEALERWGEATEALRSIVTRVEEALEVEYEIAVDEILDLATSVASKIVRREIGRDDEFATNLVRRCLRRLANRTEVLVRVNPEDRAAIEAAGDALLTEAGAGHHLRFESDRRVDRGGCVVETPDFVVDGRPRMQVALAREAMEVEA